MRDGKTPRKVDKEPRLASKEVPYTPFGVCSCGVATLGSGYGSAR